MNIDPNKPAKQAPVEPQSPADVGDAILQGLTEFRDALIDGTPLPQRFTMRTVEFQLEPRDWSSAEVRLLRERLNASQAVFAKLIGASVKTVQAWEQGNTPPPMARRLLDCIQADPRPWERILQLAAVAKDQSMN